MRRKLTLLAVTMLLGILLLITYFWHYEHFANRLIREQHYYYETANAAKHAYAAAQLYSVLSVILNDDTAENIALSLGRGNERLEQFIRFPRDTPAEIVKDLTNNQIGIIAAKWQDKNPEHALRDTILKLAEKKLLVPTSDSITMPADKAALTKQAAVDAAIEQVQGGKDAIIADVETALEAKGF